ncbi:MAG: hypothetical protein IJ335_07850, partial [Lachnospiraceae bacterium]|nr:hypothetical protein [Lachnospiraceae bacterium]
SLYKATFKLAEAEDRLRFLVSQVERITGLKDFGVYMNKLLTIDAMFLNEDRHTHNIAVLMNGKGEFAYCPLFDHGAGLLADTAQDYPLQTDVYQLLDEVHAKTISRDFEEQLMVSENLYGEHLKFTFTKQDVRML